LEKSMTTAILEVLGHQYHVKASDTLVVDGTHGEVGQPIKIGTMLYLHDHAVAIGTPTLGQPFILTVKAHQKSPKISTLIFKAKSRYRRHRGHRQGQTVLEVTSLGTLKPATPAKTTTKPVAPRAKAAATPKTTPKLPTKKATPAKSTKKA
jgi:ribosomal protein L21